MAQDLQLDRLVGDEAPEGSTPSAIRFIERVSRTLALGLHSMLNFFGSAATYNVGNSVGEVPVLGRDGKLPISLMDTESLSRTNRALVNVSQVGVQENIDNINLEGTISGDQLLLFMTISRGTETVQLGVLPKPATPSSLRSQIERGSGDGTKVATIRGYFMFSSSADEHSVMRVYCLNADSITEDNATPALHNCGTSESKMSRRCDLLAWNYGIVPSTWPVDGSSINLLQRGTRYYIAVQELKYNSDGQLISKSPISDAASVVAAGGTGTTTSLATPSAPTVTVRPSTANGGVLRVSISTITGATSYRVYFSRSSTSNASGYALFTDSTPKSILLAHSTTYYAYVIAYDDDGNVSAQSSRTRATTLGAPSSPGSNPSPNPGPEPSGIESQGHR